MSMSADDAMHSVMVATLIQVTLERAELWRGRLRMWVLSYITSAAALAVAAHAFWRNDLAWASLFVLLAVALFAAAFTGRKIAKSQVRRAAEELHVLMGSMVMDAMKHTVPLEDVKLPTNP